MKKRKSLADVLRQKIGDCGLSALALSKETGVSQPTLTEFLRGKDVRLRTAQILMDHFGVTWIAVADLPNGGKRR